MLDNDREEDMDEPEQQNVSAIDIMGVLRTVCQLAATLLGIAVIVIGVVYVIRLLDAVYTCVRNPEEMTALVTQWTKVIGEDTINIHFADNHIKGARVFSIIILGSAAVLLAWVSLGITLAGAKIVSWTSGDREAVKKILTHVFGYHPMKRKAPGIKDSEDAKQ